jgi:hypothetical protein
LIGKNAGDGFSNPHRRASNDHNFARKFHIVLLCCALRQVKPGKV